MNNWTIGKRITLGFASVLALVAILAITSIISLMKIHRDLGAVTDDALPGITQIGEATALLNESQIDVLRHMLATRPEEKKALEEGIAAKREDINKTLQEYEKSIRLPDDRQNFDKMNEAREHYLKVRTTLLELSRAGKSQETLDYNTQTLRPAFKAYLTAADVVMQWNADHGRAGTIKIAQTLRRANGITSAFSLAAILLGIGFAVLITLGVKRALTRIAGALNDGAAQVASASNQVSASSQSLAEGASEQAASIEETSSSLEELASMTERNTENSQKANELAKQARAAADKGVRDMQTMSSAMNAIKASSDEIAKIIKTIDEIAFQTNILALNAAVEAARAGEAGMGFAVVADEVRNLAQRSAQAAKDTAAKIEGAIVKTSQGVEISSQVGRTLDDIMVKVRQLDELATEVSCASREQTQGLAQINTAVSQMDKVTQSNAGTAEESASAAEELNAQAETMKESVIGLSRLVIGIQAHPKAATPEADLTTSHKATALGTVGNKRKNRSKPVCSLVKAPVAEPALTPAMGEFQNF